MFGDWYPALRADGLKRGETAVTMLLGIPMLVGRKSDGALFAMRDLCPHRGIPLSAGWFDGETVQCKYHGWRFEPCSGQCEEIPSLTSFDRLVPTKIYANCVSGGGARWVCVGVCAGGRGRAGLRIEWAAAGAGVAEVWGAVSQRASDGGAAVQCGPRDYRADGSGAWAVCASGVVVAERGEHP